MKKRSNFIYWAFDLLALLLIGVMMLGHYLHLSPAWEQTLAIAIIVGVYSLIGLWWWTHPPTMIEPDPTKVEPATGQADAKRGHYLTKVQAHYRQVFEMNAKRK